MKTETRDSVGEKTMKLPEVNVSFKELYRMLVAPIRSKLLLTGIKLKVFNHLSEPKSAKTVAEAIGAHSVNTGLFLDGLTACDLLEKKKGLYQNTPVTQTFLVEGSPIFLGQTFAHQAESGPYTLDDLPKLVKEGPPLPSKTYTASDEMSVEDVSSYVNFERAGLAQKIAGIASELPEFPMFRKMLDLGGGPGINGISIVAAHPNMKGVIFDRPRTIKLAEASIKDYEMEDRMEVLSGDYAQDSIGEGYDLILASDTLYYNKDEMNSLVKKIHDALNSDGVFISLHQGLTHERTKPESMVLGMMLEGLMGEDMGLLDQGFIADSMLCVGFRSVCSRTLDMDCGPLDLDIGRKA